MKPYSLSQSKQSTVGICFAKLIDLLRYLQFYHRAKSEYLELWQRRDSGVLLDIGLSKQTLEERLTEPIWSTYWRNSWKMNRRSDL